MQTACRYIKKLKFYLQDLKKKIKHHLYGFISVKKIFSVGEWYKLVSKKIKQINKKRKKSSIVVGGTGLYFKA